MPALADRSRPGPGPHPAARGAASSRLADDWPTYLRRLHGPPLQLAHTSQPRRPSRTSRWPGCSRLNGRSRAAAPRRGRRGAFGGGGGGGEHDRRRRRHWRVHGHERQGRDPQGERHALRHVCRPRLGDRRARRARDLALRVADARRHAHRQPRRGHLEQLPVLRNARRLPGVARRANRSRALARRDRVLRAAVLLDRWRRSWWAITCSSGPATTWTRPGSCSRSIPRPASGTGSSTRCR